MGRVQVRDTSIWIRHIEGNEELKECLSKLASGERIRLRVGGELGEFEKMRPNPHGSTPGLKPVGDTRQLWRKFYPERAGEFIDIAFDDEPASPAGGASSTVTSGPVTAGEVGASRPSQAEWFAASEAERSAAWEAFKALAKAGWRSEAPGGNRDDLHER